MGWRNWQTQRTQNPPGFGPWGFDSPSRHQRFPCVLARAEYSIRAAGDLNDARAAGMTLSCKSAFIPNPGGHLSEAIWLTNRADVRLFIDKHAARGERFAVNFQQVKFLDLVFQHTQGSSGSQALGLFQ